MIPAGFDFKNPNYDPVWADRVAKLRAIRANPDKVPGLKAFYKDHPVEFINDWGVTFDPRNAERGLPTTMPFLLFPKQEEFVRFVVDCWKNREDWLCEKSRDMGISWVCMSIAVWMWLFHEGAIAGFGSRKEEYVDNLGDAKSLFWKGRTFIDLLPGEFKPRGYNPKKHAPFMRILNPENGAAIIGEAGDNIGRGARTSIYFKDESAHYEHPDAVDAALSQTSNCKGDISTPNGEGNPFWQKRHGGKTKVFIFDWRDDPRKGPEWYAKQKHDLSPSVLAQEVDRDYSASITNSFIAGDLVTAAMHRGPADVAATGPLMVGLDVARYGDDKCVLTFRRGRLLIRQVQWGKTSITATAGRAKQEILRFKERPAQIAVDVIGVGAGAADLLRDWYGDIVQDVNSSLRMSDGQNYNLRAFMWQQMRDWLHTAAIPNDPALRTDLAGLRYSYRGGEMLLESKDDAKKRGMKSPDYGDSLALTFAYPPKKPERQIPAGRIATYEIDPEMGL